MFETLRTRIDRELCALIEETRSSYGLKKICPLLFESIKDFALRDGKRVRPVLFVLGYRGYASRVPRGLYRSAVSLELLHDFMLAHDDIIDKSDTRRGKPSLHRYLGSRLDRKSGLKFNGTDLAIVAGDVMYALALSAFLNVREEPLRKEAAFKKLIEAALYTGSGEFLEVLFGTTPIERVTLDDIYKIYDLKTANYTFASPLTIGATLAGASRRELALLFDYGTYLGRAFQIKDDIIGIFSDEKKIGKSNMTDLQEAKKTVLIWYAYRHSSARDKRTIRGIFLKKTLRPSDLTEMRRIITGSGSLEYARREVKRLLGTAGRFCASLRMDQSVRKSLSRYAETLLDV